MTLCLIALELAFAQTLAFEVASIKVSHDAGNESWVMEDQSGNFTSQNATLKGLIRI